MIEVYKKLYDTFYILKDQRMLISNSKSFEVIQFLKEYIPKISDALGETYYVRDLLLSIYRTGSFLQPHIDYKEEELKDSLGVLFYFNDDFIGGELYLPNFNYSYKPKKGSVLIFPCNNLTYKHGVTEITQGTRYTMPVEVTTKSQLSVYQL
jgi:Rps23 Pro-64 3,4-dihydroxylase Tpa1-like proline 4-hydroxylase